jgi:DNA-directed RNA polymerase subunit M/transcription elongation factor TFIIS
MWGLRLGDDIDDFCVKCKRVTNHSVLAIVGDAPAKVRCRTCYHEQEFRDSVAPPTKRELKKAAEAAAAAAAEAEAATAESVPAEAASKPSSKAGKPPKPKK